MRKQAIHGCITIWHNFFTEKDTTVKQVHSYSLLCATPAAADFTILTSISLFIRSTSSVNCCVRIFSFTKSCTQRNSASYCCYHYC